MSSAQGKALRRETRVAVAEQQVRHRVRRVVLEENARRRRLRPRARRHKRPASWVGREQVAGGGRVDGGRRAGPARHRLSPFHFLLHKRISARVAVSSLSRGSDFERPCRRARRRALLLLFARASSRRLRALLARGVVERCVALFAFVARRKLFLVRLFEEESLKERGSRTVFPVRRAVRRRPAVASVFFGRARVRVGSRSPTHLRAVPSRPPRAKTTKKETIERRSRDASERRSERDALRLVVLDAAHRRDAPRVERRRRAPFSLRAGLSVARAPHERLLGRQGNRPLLLHRRTQLFGVRLERGHDAVELAPRVRGVAAKQTRVPARLEGREGAFPRRNLFAPGGGAARPPPREETDRGRSSFSRASGRSADALAQRVPRHSVRVRDGVVRGPAPRGSRSRVQQLVPHGKPRVQTNLAPAVFQTGARLRAVARPRAPLRSERARAICASVHPGLTIANANSSPGPYMEVVTENEPRPCFSKSDSGTISSARETSHAAHAPASRDPHPGADRPPGQPTSSTRHAGQGPGAREPRGGTPHVFTAKVARTPAGLTQSRPRRSAHLKSSGRRFGPREPADRSASPRRRRRRRRFRPALGPAPDARGASRIGIVGDRRTPASGFGARASPIRRLRRLQRTIEGPAPEQRPFSLRLLVRPVDHGIERRHVRVRCDRRSTNARFVERRDATYPVGRVARVVSPATSHRLRFPDETRRRFLATSFPLWRQRTIRDVRHHHWFSVRDRSRSRPR